MASNNSVKKPSFVNFVTLIASIVGVMASFSLISNEPVRYLIITFIIYLITIYFFYKYHYKKFDLYFILITLIALCSVILIIYNYFRSESSYEGCISITKKSEEFRNRKVELINNLSRDTENIQFAKIISQSDGHLNSSWTTMGHKYALKISIPNKIKEFEIDSISLWIKNFIPKEKISLLDVNLVSSYKEDNDTYDDSLIANVDPINNPEISGKYFCAKTFNGQQNPATFIYKSIDETRKTQYLLIVNSKQPGILEFDVWLTMKLDNKPCSDILFRDQKILFVN